MTAIQKAREALRGQLALLHSLANDITEANWQDKRLYVLQTCVRMSDALAALDAETEVKVRECATEGCGAPATVHFIRDDVGSHYCHRCYMQIQALVPPESRS